MPRHAAALVAAVLLGHQGETRGLGRPRQVVQYDR